MSARFCGTGSCVPDYVMDNDGVAEFVETSDSWIRERTGIARRHIAVKETTVSMANEAAKRALDNAGVLPEELDLILMSTISSDVIIPCGACEVQKAIGADKAVCFDLNGACTGFVLAYNTALAYIESGIYQTVLIVGSESLSRLTNWKDRGTCILFGDGAGAAVIKKDERASYIPAAHSDGTRGEALLCHSKREENGLPLQNNDEIGGKHLNSEDYLMQMDGQGVFRFAIKQVPEVIQEVLEKNEVKPEEIDWYILHQANRRILEAVAKRMGEPVEKFPMNMEEYGNTSSASIPILLDEMNRDGRLKRGQKIVLAGFGAGLTWGATIIEW